MRRLLFLMLFALAFNPSAKADEKPKPIPYCLKVERVEKDGSKIGNYAPCSEVPHEGRA